MSNNDESFITNAGTKYLRIASNWSVLRIVDPCSMNMNYEYEHFVFTMLTIEI